MAFYRVVMEGVCAAFGWQGGPMGNTEIQEQNDAVERRRPRSDRSRHFYNLPFQNIRSEEYLAYLKSFHQVMYEQTHSFLILDELDHTADNDIIGPAPSGTTPVQLVRAYHVRQPNGTIVASRYRVIEKPDEDSVVLYQADGSGNPVAKAGTVDPDTGLFTPSTAWTAGRALTWSGNFWVPVRFNSDYLPFSIDNKSNGQFRVNGAVELKEVFGEEE